MTSLVQHRKKTGVSNVDIAGAYKELRDPEAVTQKTATMSCEVETAMATEGPMDIDDIEAQIAALAEAAGEESTGPAAGVSEDDVEKELAELAAMTALDDVIEGTEGGALEADEVASQEEPVPKMSQRISGGLVPDAKNSQRVSGADITATVPDATATAAPAIIKKRVGLPVPSAKPAAPKTALAALAAAATEAAARKPALPPSKPAAVPTKPAAGLAKPIALPGVKKAGLAPIKPAAPAKDAEQEGTRKAEKAPAQPVAAKPKLPVPAKPIAAKPLATKPAAAKPSAPVEAKVKKIAARVTQDEEEGEEAGDKENAKPAAKPVKPVTTTAAKGVAIPKKPSALPTKAEGPKKETKEKEEKKPRAKTAFMIFSTEVRSDVKAEFPDLSMPEMAKKLGEMWASLNEEEKLAYKEKAEAEKESMKDKIAEYEAAHPKEKKARSKEPKEEGAVRVKTPYIMFCEVHREEIKAGNPGISFGEIGKALAEAWKECDPDEKAEYERRYLELKEAAKEAKASKAPEAGTKNAAKVTKRAAEDAEEDGEEAAPAKKSAARKPNSRPSKKTKKGEQAQDGDAAAADEAPKAPVSRRAAAAEDDGDDSDREDVDWEEHPAEMIIGHTVDGKYMVKRVGMDFTSYGKVDARAAKRQRFEGPSEAGCPVGLEQVEEYEAFVKRFWSCVHERMDRGDLDLEDLEEGSPLEACYYLGKLQEPHHPLSREAQRKNDNDAFIKVPALGLSLMVQRMLDSERVKCTALQAEVEALRAQVLALGGGLEEEAIEEPEAMEEQD